MHEFGRIDRHRGVFGIGRLVEKEKVSEEGTVESVASYEVSLIKLGRLVVVVEEGCSSNGEAKLRIFC